MSKVPNYLLDKGGVGKSKKLADTAFWIDDIPSDIIELLDRLYRDKDPTLLLPCLNVPEATQPYFGDLFDRMRLQVKKRGLPKFRMRESVIKMHVAVKAKMG
jgi:hypothetical protein